MAYKPGQDSQAVIKAGVIGQDEVGIIHIRADIPFEGGQHVVLIAVEHIFQGVVAFNLVSFDTADYFEIFLGMHEDFEVEECPNFFEVKNEDPLHHNNGRWSEAQHAGFGEFVVENILLSGNGFTADQFFAIFDEGVFIDGFRAVEIIHPLLIYFLSGARKVVVIEREYAHFRLAESGFEVFD